MIRGPPSSGKTTITKKLIKELKLDKKLDCAYISEDNFRKEMQNKYKANDKKMHLQSFELIKNTILKILELDNYDYIFIEGLFRYQELLTKYEELFKEYSFSHKWILLDADIEVLLERDKQYRNTKSKDLLDLKKEIEQTKIKYDLKIDSSKPIDEIKKEIEQYL